MIRTRKGYKTNKNNTRKKQTNVKRITIQNNYKSEDGEKDIPLNVYTHEQLPIPNEYDINNKKKLHFFILTQDETQDEFYASVKATYDGFEILVGGNKLQGCITLILKRVDRHNRNSLVECTLGVNYNEYCNITNDLSRGIGTITLMKTAISFMFVYFKVDKFILKDKSTIHCYGSEKISLPALYILKHGESWYNKHINARIYNKKMLTNIEKYKRFVASKPSWEDLYNTYILPDFKDSQRDTKTDELVKQILHDTWLRTSTYRDFILELTSNDDNCKLLDEWFNKVFDDNVDVVFYGQVDNFVLYDEFPFVKGFKALYDKTVDSKKQSEAKENDIRIKTLLENKEYTGGMKIKDDIIFTEIKPWNK